MKKVILGIVIGVLVTSGIGVVAYNYNAKDIEYSPSDSSWNVNNVSDAIDSLKNSSKITLVKIGDYNSLTNQSVDVKSILPNDYQNLTIDNFVFRNIRESYATASNADAKNYLASSYDSNTGILLLKKSIQTNNNMHSFIMDYSVYCILGDVEIRD